MKLHLTFKHSDAVRYGIEDALQDYSESKTYTDEEEKELDINNKRDELNALVAKWVEFGEYIRVEIDSETKEIKVLEN